MCVYTPLPNEFYDKFHKIIKDFLWGTDKTPKIAHSKLVQDYDNNGLKLVDLKTKNLSLKAAWVDRFLFGNTELSILKNMLPVKYDLIWKPNIKAEDIVKILTEEQRGLSISIDIWKAWASFNYLEPQTTQEVLDQQLWYNFGVLHEKKPYISSSSLYTSRVCLVKDIYIVEENRFMTWLEMVNKYNCQGHFLEQLKCNIPGELTLTGIVHIKEENQPGRKIYQSLIKT